MREFLRGSVRLHILHHAAQHEVHGAWLTTELAHHGYRISPGSLYARCTRWSPRASSGPACLWLMNVPGSLARGDGQGAAGARRPAKRQFRELPHEVLGFPVP